MQVLQAISFNSENWTNQTINLFAMNALACYLFVLSVIIAPIHGKPQLSNQEAIIGKTL